MRIKDSDTALTLAAGARTCVVADVKARVFAAIRRQAFSDPQRNFFKALLEEMGIENWPAYLTNLLLRPLNHSPWRGVHPGALSPSSRFDIVSNYAFSVFPDLRPATAALQRPRDERW